MILISSKAVVLGKNVMSLQLRLKAQNALSAQKDGVLEKKMVTATDVRTRVSGKTALLAQSGQTLFPLTVNPALTARTLFLETAHLYLSISASFLR